MFKKIMAIGVAIITLFCLSACDWQAWLKNGEIAEEPIPRGEFFGLQEAYDKGLLTVEDLRSIAYYWHGGLEWVCNYETHDRFFHCLDDECCLEEDCLNGCVRFDGFCWHGYGGCELIRESCRTGEGNCELQTTDTYGRTLILTQPLKRLQLTELYSQ